jgi:hypothetical protein
MWKKTRKCFVGKKFKVMFSKFFLLKFLQKTSCDVSILKNIKKYKNIVN